jgi:hypothetical protein
MNNGEAEGDGVVSISRKEKNEEWCDSKTIKRWKGNTEERNIRDANKIDS